MINLHDKAITELLPRIGPKAFSVLLVICKHLNRKNTAFPSKLTIMKLTNMGRDAVTRELSVLEDAGLLRKEQRNKAGKFSTNLYTVTTNLIGVYVPAIDAGEMEEEPCTESQATVNTSPCTESPCTESPSSESQSTISIEQGGSIEQEKVFSSTTATREAKKLYDQKDPETDLSNPDAGIVAAKKMADHYKGEGAGQWEYMGGPMKGEDESRYPDPDAVDSVTWDWANSEKNRHLLPYWRMHVGKIRNWITAYKNKNHETTNSTTNGRVQQQRKAGAFLSPDERKRRLGLL